MSKKNDNGGGLTVSLANAKVLTTRFFRSVLERQFTEAERILESLKTKMRKNDWNRGYLWALNGMLLAQKASEEKTTYLANVDLDDEETLKKSRREFSNYVKSDFHTDYDRGFFSAWTDFLRVVLAVRGSSKQVDKEK